MKTTPEKTISWTTFTDVFDLYFWIVLAVMTIVLSLAFYLSSFCLKDETRIELTTSTVTVLLALIGQSIPIENPRRLSMRFLLQQFTKSQTVSKVLKFLFHNVKRFNFLKLSSNLEFDSGFSLFQLVLEQQWSFGDSKLELSVF